MEINNKIIRYLSIDKWYHGTTLEGWKSICKLGVLVKYNIGYELDFGYGFYLTLNQQDAEKYIVNLLKFESYIDFGIPLKKNEDNKILVVIEFSFTPIEWYNQGKYKFGFFNAYNDEFAEFVFHNRLNNLDGSQQHDYDVIFGVMSDSLPILLMQKYKEGKISREDAI